MPCRVRLIKNKLDLLIAQVEDHARVLDQLLDDEEDLACMNLTALHAQPELFKSVSHSVSVSISPPLSMYMSMSVSVCVCLSVFILLLLLLLL